MTQRLDPELVRAIVSRIERSERRGALAGADGVPPVHTLRIPADHFRHDSVARAGARALRLLQTFAPDSVVLALALRLPGCEALPTDPGRVDALLGRLDANDPTVHPSAALAHDVYRRVLRQLSRRPVQDLRIDFHESLAPCSDEEEDAIAAAAATELALALHDVADLSGQRPESPTLGARVGVRLKPLSGNTVERAIVTLDRFVSSLVDRAGGLPDPFVVTLPAVSHSDQASAGAQLVGALETRLGLARGVIRLEIGISDPGVVFDESGGCQVPALVTACGGRCVGVRLDPGPLAHALGTRDSGGAEVVRDLIRLAIAGREVPISWGSSPDLPRSRGRETPDRFNAVHAAWRNHAEAVLRSIRAGYPSGWDHDAGQIPARLAAVAVHYRQILPSLRADIAEMLVSSAPGDPPDRMALGQRLMDEVALGIDSGALGPEDLHGTGLEPEDLALRSWRISVDRRAR